MRAFVCVSLLALAAAKPSKIASTRNGDLLSCAAGTNLGDKLAGAMDQCGLFEPDTRSIDVILKEAKGRNGLGVDCQDITNHLGITDDGNICESVVSCISNFNGYPSCEEVQGCFGGLPFTRQNLAMPTCQEIDTVLQYIEDYINNAVLNTRSLAKNRDDSCPSFQDIVDYLQDEYADDMCVLQSMGWITDDLQFDEANIESDLAELPEELLAGFEDFEGCVDDFVEEYESHECADSYSGDEATELASMLEMVAKYECFKDILGQGCLNM